MKPISSDEYGFLLCLGNIRRRESKVCQNDHYQKLAKILATKKLITRTRGKHIYLQITELGIESRYYYFENCILGGRK